MKSFASTAVLLAVAFPLTGVSAVEAKNKPTPAVMSTTPSARPTEEVAPGGEPADLEKLRQDRADKIIAFKAARSEAVRLKDVVLAKRAAMKAAVADYQAAREAAKNAVPNLIAARDALDAANGALMAASPKQ